MKKRFVIFLQPGHAVYGTLPLFSHFLGEQLERRGAEVSYIESMPAEDTYAPALMEQIHLGIDAALAFNAIGQQETSSEGRNVWDLLGVPFFNYILDHPFVHHDNMISEFRNHHVICVDRDHVAYIKRYYPHIPHAHFLPIGGMPYRGGNTGGYGERIFEVSFTGSYVPLSVFGESIQSLSENRKKMAWSMVEYLLSNRTASFDHALEALLKNQGFETVSPEMIVSCAPELRFANAYVRMYLREELIRTVAGSGMPLHIFGQGWELMKDVSWNRSVLHGSVDYMETARVAAQSKVMLCDCACFRNGLHDRVTTALLNGAAVVTDANTFIREQFLTDGNDQEIAGYDVTDPEHVPDLINELLSDAIRSEKIAIRGRAKAAERYTWEHTAEYVLSTLMLCVA